MLDAGCWILPARMTRSDGDAGYWLLVTGYWLLAAGFWSRSVAEISRPGQESWSRESGGGLSRNHLFYLYFILRPGWLLDTGCWMLVTGSWILDIGYWILDIGYWMLDTRYCPPASPTFILAGTTRSDRDA